MKLIGHINQYLFDKSLMFLFLEVGNSQSVSHIQTGDLVELNCHTICQSFEHFLFGDDASILG
jgi:hypothetical protein